MANILILSLVFSPDSVSTSFLMTELSRELKKRGHTISVITTTPHYNIDRKLLSRHPLKKIWKGILYFSDLDDITIWHIKLPQKGQRAWIRVLDFVYFHLMSMIVFLIKVPHQDIILTTSPPPTMGLISWWMKIRWRARSIYKVAELYPDIITRQGLIKNPIIIFFLKSIEKLVYIHNDAIVPIAEQFRKVIRQRNVPDKRLFMIPDFVDTNFYKPLPRVNEFSREHQLADSFILLYAGNVGIVQDWELLLFAASQLVSFSMTIVIIGDGARRQWLKREISDRRLDNIRMIDYQPQERMPDIIASCDIALIPMTAAGGKDGVPSKIYSLMSCAKPILATVDTDSEIGWIIQQSGGGRISPPGNKEKFVDMVLDCYKTFDIFRRAGVSGRTYVLEHYSKEAIADQYDDLIKALTT
jgi:colanic acid biosynthesis glycosyl transferase WcaI